MKGPFPRAYGVGQGFVVSASGHRLSMSACTAALARHVAASSDPTARPSDVAFAQACTIQLTEAMTASFETAQETLPL